MVRTDGYAYSRFIGLTWDGSGIADVGIDHASGITNKQTCYFLFFFVFLYLYANILYQLITLLFSRKDHSFVFV
jgi:hypothetical protein